MTRIVLVRPGSTDFDDQGRVTGTLNLPLNTAGVAQSEQMASQMSGQGVTVVYSSPSQAALETARILASSLSVKVKTLANLYNLDHGLWQGRLVADLREKQKKVFRQWQEQPETVCPPEGELVSQAVNRVRDSLDRLTRKHKHHVIALVVPEPLTTLVRGYLEHAEFGDLWTSEWACGSWHVIEAKPRQLAAALQ
jgi:probable phosphoglycerate mutase